MLIGLLWALLAGSLVGLQNIFNNKVDERARTWTTTTLVLGLGFLASFLIGLIVEGGNLFNWQNMQPWFWFSGVIGVGVVFCTVNGIKLLGPTYAISIAMAAQLIFALLWDSLGWFGLERVPFSIKQLVGVLIVIGGIFVFKFGGLRQTRKAAAEGE
ncbi:DMT family transporter [Paenibacillus sp. M1]|uniref:DMT family transporter n=1 Tax=Paenibacillus haidiansis TaxID=1574488 RepID=A0ABU7VR37_9BACL